MNFIDSNNNTINIEAIKIFKIDELGKEYIIYSIRIFRYSFRTP